MLNEQPKSNKKVRRSPALIAKAPDDLPSSHGDERDRLITELQEENAELNAEQDRLRAVVDIEKVKATLIEPYANKVFLFLVFYCLGVFIIILLDGFRANGFKLAHSVAGIISGSTAVAAIGLVGIVVKGLFGPSGRPSNEPTRKRRSRRR